MPGKVKVRLGSARDLPVMNTAAHLTSAYATIKLDQTSFRTETCRKTLHPVWNYVCSFEVDDEELQDEILLIKLWDYDSLPDTGQGGYKRALRLRLALAPYICIGHPALPLNPVVLRSVGQDDAIGQVMIDLDPLLKWDAPPEISGWFPIYDTLKGIRGMLHVGLKIAFMKDHNRYTDTSCGVQVLTMTAAPECYGAAKMLGFVEELIIKDDPEFQWMDKIRSPRASNEARQAVFAELDGELQRKIGRKVIAMGGNAVLGYRQEFDLEGDSMVARGIGTAVQLSRGNMDLSPHLLSRTHATQGSTAPPPSPWIATSSSSSGSPTAHGHSPRNDPRPSITVGASGLISGLGVGAASNGRSSDSTPLSPRSVPLVTLTKFPVDVIVHLGGVVKACSIKLCNNDILETRDAWWSEIRDEIRSHALELGYTSVVGYSETTSIQDGVVLLTAVGTAAVLASDKSMKCESQDLLSTIVPLIGSHDSGSSGIGHSSPLKIQDSALLRKRLILTDDSEVSPDSSPSTGAGADPDGDTDDSSPPIYKGRLSAKDFTSPTRHCCNSITLPNAALNGTFGLNSPSLRCRVCKRGIVPDVLMCSVEPPEMLQMVGQSRFVQARVCRHQRRPHNKEEFAGMIGSTLPFLEHELHQQLMNKLKVTGRNALFNMRCYISIGEDLMCGIASATAVYLPALAQPPLLQIVRHAEVVDAEDAQLLRIQRQLEHLSSANRDALERAEQDAISSGHLVYATDQIDESDTYEMAAGDGKAAHQLVPGPSDRIRRNLVVHVDDETDEDIMAVLLDPDIGEGLHVCTTETLPNIEQMQLEESAEPPHCITVLRRENLKDTKSINQRFAVIFKKVVEVACFKMRKLRPCVLANVRFELQTPDDDEVLITMIGTAFRLKPRQDAKIGKLEDPGSGAVGGDGLFEIDDVDGVQQHARGDMKDASGVAGTGSPPMPQEPSFLHEALRQPLITPMFHVPGCRIERHLGALSLYLIRETTSLRDQGGFSQFLRVFVSEVLAIAKAHVLSRGGNALIAYRLKEPVLLENTHKNQGQCLLSVTGDVAVRLLLPRAQYVLRANPASAMPSMPPLD